MALCADCKEHEATITFSDSTTSYIHGWSIKICRCCYVKRIEKALLDIQENYEREKAKLEKEGCK